jgi:hypothetical protein
LLPFILPLIFVIVLNGHLMSRFGYYMPWYLLGGICELMAAALMYTVTRETSVANIYGYTALMAVGVAAFNQAGFSVVQAKVKPEEIPYALGFMMVSQLGGIVIALGVAGAIFVNKTVSGLEQLLPQVPDADIRNGIAGTTSAFFQNLSKTEKIAALDVIVGSIADVYVLLIVAGAMTVVGSVFLKREKLFIQAAMGGA